MVVRIHLAVSGRVEVQRTSSRKTGGELELTLMKSCVVLVPEYKLASISLLLTPLSLHCFLLLPGNLQLELSHGDGNQMRGIWPAAGATAAGEWIQSES